MRHPLASIAHNLLIPFLGWAVFAIARSHSGALATLAPEYAREQLTAYKVPRESEFRDELPKANIGKILRRELRDG